MAKFPVCELLDTQIAERLNDWVVFKKKPDLDLLETGRDHRYHDYIGDLRVEVTRRQKVYGDKRRKAKNKGREYKGPSIEYVFGRYLKNGTTIECLDTTWRVTDVYIEVEMKKNLKDEIKPREVSGDITLKLISGECDETTKHVVWKNRCPKFYFASDS